MTHVYRSAGERRTTRPALSALLPALLLAGCINSGSAPSLQDVQKQQSDAVAAIKAKGKIEEKTYPVGKGWVVGLSGATITDDDVEHLRSIDRLAELDLSRSTVTDDQLVQLVAAEANGQRKAATLHKLDLSGTGVSDAVLEELSGLKLLAELKLKGTKVTDAGVKNFELRKKVNPLPFGLKLKVEK